LTVLLDVNVIVALIDPTHVAHDAAHGWFEAVGRRDWATCPLTENGVIRRLATFDRRLSTAAVREDKAALFLIGST
jgi:predicted nucleic acid-binding protein